MDKSRSDWNFEMDNHQNRHHSGRGQMSDYREKIPPNSEGEEGEEVLPYGENDVDSEWEDFEKLLR